MKSQQTALRGRTAVAWALILAVVLFRMMGGFLFYISHWEFSVQFCYTLAAALGVSALVRWKDRGREPPAGTGRERTGTVRWRTAAALAPVLLAFAALVLLGTLLVRVDALAGRAALLGQAEGGETISALRWGEVLPGGENPAFLELAHRLRGWAEAGTYASGILWMALHLLWSLSLLLLPRGSRHVEAVCFVYPAAITVAVEWVMAFSEYHDLVYHEESLWPLWEGLGLLLLALLLAAAWTLLSGPGGVSAGRLRIALGGLPAAVLFPALPRLKDLGFIAYYPDEAARIALIPAVALLALALTGRLPSIWRGSVAEEAASHRGLLPWALRLPGLLIPLGVYVASYRVSLFYLLWEDISVLEYGAVYLPPLSIIGLMDFQQFTVLHPVFLRGAVEVAALALWGNIISLRNRVDRGGAAWCFVQAGMLLAAMHAAGEYDAFYPLLLGADEWLGNIFLGGLFIVLAGFAWALLFSLALLIRPSAKSASPRAAENSSTAAAHPLCIPLRRLGVPLLCLVIGGGLVLRTTLFRPSYTWEDLEAMTDRYFPTHSPGTAYLDNISIQAELVASPALPEEREDEEGCGSPLDWADPEPLPLQGELADYARRSAALLLGEEEGNLLYSPVTSFVGMSILAACTEGEAAEEILESLGLEDGSEVAALLEALYMDRGEWLGRQLPAQSLWTDQRFPVDPDLAALLAEDYLASVYRANFSSPQAQADVNAWVQRETRGTVEGMEVPPGTALLLASTLYFEGGWAYPFNPAATGKGDFYAPSGTVRADFMPRVEERHRFIRTDTFSASCLEFSHGAAIHFILPHEGVTPGRLLEEDALLRAIDYAGEDARGGAVSFRVPKLRFSSQLDLNETARALGARSLYRGAAVAGYAGGVDIRQGNAIELDEQGVRAASAWGMSLTLGVGPSDYLELHLNRPFLFVVTSPEGAVLFVGRVNDPTLE